MIQKSTVVGFGLAFLSFGSICSIAQADTPMAQAIDTTPPATDAKVVVPSSEFSLVDVMDKLKSEIYFFQANEWINNQKNPQPAGKAPVCSGLVDVKLDTIKVVLTVKNDSTVSGEGGLKVPIGPITIGPDINGSSEAADTQTLTFTATPQPITSQPPAPWLTAAVDPNVLKYHPIASSLINFRDSMNIEAAKHTLPCFNLGSMPSPDNKGSSDNSYEIGFQVVNQYKGSVGLNFLIFSLSAAKANSQTAANTITVSFKATGYAVHTEDK